MHDDPDTPAFEERRAEVLEIVRSAAHFAGAEQSIRAISRPCVLRQMRLNRIAFDEMSASLAENTSRYLQSV